MLKEPKEKNGENILIQIDELARIMACSPRHIYRMEEQKKMPAKVKFGQLVRWRRSEIMTWINAGCPGCPGGILPKMKENTDG